MVNYGGQMIFVAQTDPAWEYWGTSTYLAIAGALAAVVTLMAWLVYRHWRNVRAQEYERTI